MRPVYVSCLVWRTAHVPHCHLGYLQLLFISRPGKQHTIQVASENELTPDSRTYLVSSPVISYLYTQMIGDPKNMPTIKASANFSGIAIIGAFCPYPAPTIDRSLELNRCRSRLVCQPEQLVSPSYPNTMQNVVLILAQLPLCPELHT